MSQQKDDVVNKAIIFTRPWRNMRPDDRDLFDLGDADFDALIDLCSAVRKFVYGEQNCGYEDEG